MKQKSTKEDVVGRLIVSRMSGTISREDDALLDAWIDESDANKDLYDEYVAIDRRFRMTGSNDVEEALKKVHERTGIGRKKSRTVMCAAGVAVALVSALGIFAGVSGSRTDEDESLQRIVNVDNTAMHYVLPDGSDIWLKTGSEISYDGGFNTSCRTVALKGEAYFDVTSNPDCPFYVVTDDYKVRVLGTVFNIKSYDRSSMEVMLAKGSVAMQTSSGQNLFCLKPGQKATYSPDLQAFDITETPIGNILLLKYGVVSLMNASVEEILAAIEQEMGVQVVCEGTADPRKRYNFNFQKGSSPESVVELLGFICTGLTFNIQK